MGEKSGVGKRQLSDVFFNGFRACKETLEVEETAVCSDTDVDAVWQSSFALRSIMLKKMENDVGGGGQEASLLDTVGDGEAAQ